MKLLKPQKGVCNGKMSCGYTWLNFIFLDSYPLLNIGW
jgi:hypothetical protein